VYRIKEKTMKKNLVWSLLVGLALILSTSTNLVAKSDNADSGAYTAADKELYLTEAQIAFIRPGLEVEILDVVIPADLLTEVTFRLTDPAGLPLDRDGIYTPGPVSTSFILSFIPAGEEAYVAYTTRVQTSPITGDSATQATTDSGGTYTDMGDGVYMYKFGTLVPEDYDVDATHTMGMYARRDLTEFNLDRYVSNELDHFVPSNNGIPDPRQYVTTPTCNRCHDPLAIHGGSRQEVGLCILCHNPTQSIDPDTGDSVDMPYMVHKIHAGVHLANGYTIIGYRQGVHDYSEVEFPTDLNACEVCHTGGVPTDDFPMVAGPNPTPACDGSGRSMTTLDWMYPGRVEIRLGSADGRLFATGGPVGSVETGKWVWDGLEFVLVDAASGEAVQELAVNTTVFGCATNPPGTFRGVAAEDHTVWMTNPSRWVCGSCHDDIDFENGEGHLAQSNDDNCATCHRPDTGVEYDISVAGAHTVDYKSNQLGGVLVQIISIKDTDPGDKPTVTFSLNDKNGPLDPAELNRLRFTITGPNEDFAYYVQEDVLSGMWAVGTNWSYRFSTRMPNDAEGSYSFGVEGRIADVLINEGEDNEFEMEDQIQNFIVPIAVTDDNAEARDMIVDDATCENCHSNLTLHGTNRHDANGYCQTCHRPDATDAVVVPPGAGPDQSIHFKYMVHKIHRGADLERGYLVYGYRSSLHDYSHVEYPGDLRNCQACHNEGTYNLPLPAGRLDTVAPQDFWSPMQPVSASCLSCHDGSEAAAHAANNTSDFGEACTACHGEGKFFSVEEVHAR
jgi:hypothetical protein